MQQGPEGTAQTDYRVDLLAEMVARKRRNSAYSIRAFARDLGVSKTALSDVLAGRRDFSRQAVERVAAKLGLTPAQKARWSGGFCQASFLQLEDDQFRLISDWPCIAILLLPRLRTHKADPKWIARRFAITEAEARLALESVVRLGLVRIEAGRIVRTTAPVKVEGGRVSAAVRKYHRQNLELAARALEAHEIHERTFSAISLPFDPKKMARAEKLINDFKERFARAMACEQGPEAYTLSIHLFPLTCPIERKKKS